MFTPNHGDIFGIKDREQIGVGMNGGVRTFTPNPWYAANTSIPKEKVVSLYRDGSISKVAVTDSTNFTRAAGITLTGTVNGKNELQTSGDYVYSTDVFTADQIGQIAYVVDEIISSTCLTTDRALAQENGDNLIEMGVISGLNSIYIDIQGDTRGSVPVAQASYILGEAITTDNKIVLVSLGSDGKVYRADKRKSENDVGTDPAVAENRNYPIGFIVEASTGFATTIPLGTNVVVQTSGIIEKTGAFSDYSLAIGQRMYLDESGVFTTLSTISLTHIDVTCLVGYVKSVNEFVVTIGNTASGSDSYPIGSIIAQGGVTADYGWLTC